MSTWIKCSERMPIDNEMVLFYVLLDKDIYVGAYLCVGAYLPPSSFGKAGWVESGGVSWQDADVTHWMPLPEPP